MSARDRIVGKVIRVVPSPPSTLPARRDWCDLLALVLLGIFWWLAVSAAARHSATSDELPHLTAGYTYDKFGDYRLHSENGILPQRVFGLAPAALGAKLPTDEANWRKSAVWQLGWDFFYGLDNPFDRMLWWARALNALFGTALGAFIYLVARRWHGPAGGLLALGFYMFYPDFLAHTALATSDLAATLFLTLAPWFFWRHLEKRDVASGLLAAVFSGLALVAKFNGILIAPIYAALVLADAFGRAPAGGGPARLGRNLLLAGAQAAGAVLVIWAFFGFRYGTAAPGLPPLDAYPWPWDGMLRSIGGKARFIELARDWHLLPEAWLYGLTNVFAGAAARPAFFAGQYSVHGWWQFFPVLFMAKTPLAMLGALVVVLCLALKRRRADWLKLAPLAVTAGIVALTAITSNLNIGHRHIFAVYPVLFVALGGLVTLPRRWLLVPLALLAVAAVESFAVRPHYMAFINAAAGGPARGYRLVVDGSLDWGQDLPALRDWLATGRREKEPLYLAYFGNAWPPHYGVRPTVFLPSPAYLARPPFAPYEYTPGLYCISATALSGVYSDYPGQWRAAWEARYRTVPRDSEEFDRLRLARLTKYLQLREPDANAGYSILIFRLDAAELQAALAGPVKGW